MVFGTKNREPLIQPAWRSKLHAYLGGIIRTADGIAESVGGVSDHSCAFADRLARDAPFG
jgi:hypothetical protein